jgi:nicotinate-nucleotide--dimethylbenzimidazole phosphoribosyltransferase
LGLRLGEGSGAAITVPLLRMACSLHNNMATFAEAEISKKI